MRHFATGAKRNDDTGKPKLALVPYWMLQEIVGGRLHVDRDAVPNYEWQGSRDWSLVPVYAMSRVAKHYQRGAEHYGADNWQHGIPLDEMLNSLLRHVYQWALGDKSEDNMAAVVWNALTIIELEHRIKIGLLPKDLTLAVQWRNDNVGISK